MESQSYIKSTCAHCGGHIEAPAEGAGMWVRCPHCGEKTQLASSAGKTAEKEKTSRPWVWLLLVLVLAAISAAAVMGKFGRKTKPQDQASQSATTHQTAQSAATPAPEPESDLWKGLKPGRVTIEKSPKSRLIYAVGSVRNDTEKQRFGVKIILDVLDASGEKLGTTTDYTQFIDAQKEWNYKALVTDPKATSAKVSSITEE